MSAFPRKTRTYSRWLHLAACTAPLCFGCTSVESTMVTRDETNQTWERHNCLNGIPITLKVPTHVKLYVYHNHYLGIEEYTIGTDKKERLIPIELDVVVRDFAYEFMYTEKIFVVDFARPAAGSSNLRVDMTEEQYIDEIQHNITDNTIASVTGLLGAFKGTQPIDPNPAGGENLPPKPDLETIRSLVAVGIFEIEAPDFEEKARQFLDCHINKAHDAWVVPPNVGDIPRVGIPAGDNMQVPYPPVPLCPANGECSIDGAIRDSTLSGQPTPTVVP